MSDLQTTKVKGIADIVFVIDATGSMSPCIDALKNNIQTFVASLTTKDANNASPVKEWRAKVFGYRDYEHDAEPIVDNPFVDSDDELRSQLAGLKAMGGGDEAESLLEALYEVATMPESGRDEHARPDAWRHRSDAARVVVIFTDAPYKEPLVKPEGATFEDVYHRLITNRIILSIFAPDLACFAKLSEIDKAEWNVVTGGSTAQESLERFTADQRNFSETLRQLARTISKTAGVFGLDDDG